MKNYLMGLDIGGTKTECALIEVTSKQNGDFTLSSSTTGECSLKILTRERVPTNRQNGYESVLESIKNLCLSVCQKEKIALEDLEGIGIGLPGTIDPEKQTMLNGNTAIFINKQLKKDLNALFNKDLKIICENDASCFALAEVMCGAGQKYKEETEKNSDRQTGVGIILGTGVGGGIIIKEKILQGSFGGGGELGHTELITDGHPCYCGHNGCVEQYLSGPGLEATFATRIYSQISKLPSSKEIFELYEQKDPLAIAIIKQYRKHLSKFLTNLTNIFDPDFFVLGGGVSTQKAIYLGIEENIRTNSFVPSSSPKVYQHALGDSAGVIGAAILLLPNLS